MHRFGLHLSKNGNTPPFVQWVWQAKMSSRCISLKLDAAKVRRQGGLISVNQFKKIRLTYDAQWLALRYKLFRFAVF